MKGLVIKNTGSWYSVLSDDGQTIECKIRGNFRLKDIHSTNPIAVGDRVDILCNKEGVAFITDIEDRRNYVVRKSSNLSKQSHIIASNVDQAFLVITINYPETSTTFIDRFLASAEAYRIPVVLLFNKEDLLSSDELEYQQMMNDLYTTIGYPCISLSAFDDNTPKRLEPLLKDKITLFSGNSGVGKSTLLNKIMPGINLKTKEISFAHNKGTHTTTYSEMFPLPYGGWVIDTPGIKGYGSFSMAPREICGYFKEIFYFSKKCRFSNCTHTHEPGCAVREALKEHFIAESRYNSYLSMLSDMDEGKYREAF